MRWGEIFDASFKGAESALQPVSIRKSHERHSHNLAQGVLQALLAWGGESSASDCGEVGTLSFVLAEQAPRLPD